MSSPYEIDTGKFLYPGPYSAGLEYCSVAVGALVVCRVCRQCGRRTSLLRSTRLELALQHIPHCFGCFGPKPPVLEAQWRSEWSKRAPDGERLAIDALCAEYADTRIFGPASIGGSPIVSCTGRDILQIARELPETGFRELRST